MENDLDNNITSSRRRGRAMAGTILLIVGAALLVHQFDFFWFPDWLFSWPMWIIAWALYIGAKHQFRSASWVFLLLVGVVFLLNDNIPAFNERDILWPVLIICFGIWLILKRTGRWDKPKYYDWSSKKWSHDYNPSQNPNEPVVDYTINNPTDVPPTSSSSTSTDSGFRATADDYLDAVSVFGGVKKTILSKNFKGGEVVNVFGGAELDFTQSNINGQVVIDITQIFGGVKIVVPSNWRVVPDLAAVFASVDDKRIRTTANVDSDKILILKGVSIFAGVDIRSY
jgi:predicted membrane protein